MLFPLLRQSAEVTKNSKSQISNIKQITMTKIVRASLDSPPTGGSQFQKFKTCFGHLILEFEICL